MTRVDETTATSPRSSGRAEALGRLLGRPQLLVLGGVSGLAAVAWWDLLRRGEAMCPLPMGPWLWPELGMAIVMWSVMMVAMMLPSATPTILMFGGVTRRRQLEGRPAVPVAVFTLGYLAVWVFYAIVAAAAQWQLHRLALLSPSMAAASPALAGGLLIAAGVYQWMPFKAACLSHCRSPLWWRRTAA